jgi:hypothetical protein
MGDMMDDKEGDREGGAEDGNTGDAATFKLAKNRAGSNFWRESETSLRWSNAAKKRVKSKLVVETGIEGMLVALPLPWLSLLRLLAPGWSWELATGKPRKFCGRDGLVYTV